MLCLQKPYLHFGRSRPSSSIKSFVLPSLEVIVFHLNVYDSHNSSRCIGKSWGLSRKAVAARTGASCPAVWMKTWAWLGTSSRGLRIPNKSNTGGYSVSKNDDAWEFMYYFIICSIISLRTELRSQRTILENISSHLGTRPISNQQISLLHELLDWEFFKRSAALAITQVYFRMHGVWIQCWS